MEDPIGFVLPLREGNHQSASGAGFGNMVCDPKNGKLVYDHWRQLGSSGNRSTIKTRWTQVRGFLAAAGWWSALKVQRAPGD